MHVLHTVLPSLHHVLVVSAHRDGVHDYTVLPHSVAPQDKLHSTLQAEYRVSVTPRVLASARRVRVQECTH